MGTTLIPKVESGRVVGWTGKKDSHAGEPTLHDANTCLVVDGRGKILLARRSNGERKGIKSKRIGGGQWEGISTHLHRSEVARYGLDPDNLDEVNDRLFELHKVSVAERVQKEIDVEIIEGLDSIIEREDLEGILEHIESEADISHIGDFTYSMDREQDGRWSEKERCHVMVLQTTSISPQRTEEVMDFRWNDISDMDYEKMKDSPEYARWASEALRIYVEEGFES